MRLSPAHDSEMSTIFLDKFGKFPLKHCRPSGCYWKLRTPLKAVGDGCTRTLKLSVLNFGQHIAYSKLLSSALVLVEQSQAILMRFWKFLFCLLL